MTFEEITHAGGTSWAFANENVALSMVEALRNLQLKVAAITLGLNNLGFFDS